MKLYKGFTLVELLIVIVITSIVVVASSKTLLQGAQAYLNGNTLTSLSQNGSIVLMRMTKELRTAVSFTTINATTLTFTAADGTVISYSLSGANLNRSENGGASVLFTSGVSALAFTYYNSAFAVTAVTTAVKAI